MILLTIYEKLKGLKSQSITLAFILSILTPLLSLFGLFGITGYFSLNNESLQKVSIELINESYCMHDNAILKVSFKDVVDEATISFLNFSESCFNCSYFEKSFVAESNKIDVIIKYRIGNESFEESKSFELKQKYLDFNLSFSDNKIFAFGISECYKTLNLEIYKDDLLLESKVLEINDNSFSFEYEINSSGKYIVSVNNVSKSLEINLEEISKNESYLSLYLNKNSYFNIKIVA